jgi:hypothetical protein
VAKAEVCKTFIIGSNPIAASIISPSAEGGKILNSDIQILNNLTF